MTQKSRYIALLGFVGCLIGFFFLAFLTATSRYIGVSNFFVQSFYRIFPFGHGFFGVFGLILFIVSSFCLAILYSWQKYANAFKGFLYVFQFFDLPVLILFELWLLVSDYKEMDTHVIMVLANTPLANIITNWFFLVAACIMFLLSAAFHKKTFLSKFCSLYGRAFKWKKTKHNR